jgi:hypothetical protein
MTGHLTAALLLAVLTTGTLVAQDPPAPESRNWEWQFLHNRVGWIGAADDGPKLPDTATFDKLVVDTLRDIHNRGAELFNMGKDYAGAYRMYQGALITVRPFLAHRPAAQKLIDDGFAGAEKESSVAMKAFKLHEAIEAVRADLKEAGVKKPSLELAPPPREKKKPTDKKTPMPVGTNIPAGPSGKVTLHGEPLVAAEVTVVSLDQAKPKVFTARIQADGSYAFKEALPAGRYVVIVTAKTVPEKYSLTTTSGIVIDVKSAAGSYNIELK